jgi:uncharacterized membrane-anchored protein
MTVPGSSRITPLFWLALVICGCLDTPAADYLARQFGAGYAAYLVAGLAVVVLALQLGVRRPVQALHWIAVLLVSVATTLVAAMVSPYAAAVVFGIALVGAAWLGRDAGGHEEHYWLALASAFGLGAALPPLAVLPLAVLVAATVTRWRLVAFWAAVVLARVLGGAVSGAVRPWESALALVLLVAALSLPHPTWHLPFPRPHRS